MKCICHSAHLCASEACKQLPQCVEQLAHDVHNTLKHSSKRMAQFCEFQEFAGVERHRILSPSRTRWLSYSAVIKRMLEQWGALQLFFTDLHNQQSKSYSHAVKNAYELLHNPFVRLYYCFLESVLPKFTHFNLLFQSERVVINALHSKVCSLYKDILLMFMKRDSVMKQPLGNVEPRNEREWNMLEQVYLGASVLKRVTSTPDLYKDRDKMTEFRKKCRAFLVTAAEQIKKRLDFEDPVLSRLSVLKPAYVLGKKGVREHSLVPLAVHLPRIIAGDDATLQQLDDEWRKLEFEDLSENIMSGDKEVEKVKDKAPDLFWGEVRLILDSEGRSKYKCVSDFALACLSLPHANADCERCFSDINRMKTKDRNKLKTESVRDILLAKQSVTSEGNSNCTSFEPSRSMIRSMTSQVLYPTGVESDPNYPEIHGDSASDL